jgi:hypothetical protein
LKEEAKEVKIRDKSPRRESRHARRAASTGRGAAMKVYDDSAKSRREESKAPPRRKKTPAPVKKEVKREVKVEKPAQVVEMAAKPKSPEPVQKLIEDEKVKAVGVEEAFDLMSVDRSRATSVPTIGSPTESNRTDVKDDFDLLNGDSFNDPTTVKDIKKDIKEVISTKSSEIDFEEPSVQEIVPKKEEQNRSTENKSIPESPVVPEPLEIIETPQEQVLSQVEPSSAYSSLPNLSENLPSSMKNESIVDDFDLLGDLGSVSSPNAPPGGATSNNFDLLA